MLSFNELTKGGKYRRCKKALFILECNISTPHSLDKATLLLWDYEGDKSEETINNCRRELMKIVRNHYRYGLVIGADIMELID